MTLLLFYFHNENKFFFSGKYDKINYLKFSEFTDGCGRTWTCTCVKIMTTCTARAWWVKLLIHSADRCDHCM